MKKQIKNVVRRIAYWPFIGRIVRIGVVIIKLPEFHHMYLVSNERLMTPHMQQFTKDFTIEHLNAMTFLLKQQIPTLLDTISNLNHRLFALENDQNNLTQSLPVAIRQLTRDLNTLKNQFELELTTRSKIENEIKILDICNAELE